MKKLLCFTLSAVLAAALAVPAFADTSVPPTSAPQTNVTQSSTDQKAETTVQFKIDPAYTVTIPGTVELKQKNRRRHEENHLRKRFQHHSCRCPPE